METMWHFVARFHGLEHIEVAISPQTVLIYRVQVFGSGVFFDSFLTKLQ